MTWDDELPTAFPIDAISRRALQEGHARRQRRRSRRSMAGAALALAVFAAGVTVATRRDEAQEQLTAGPGPESALPIRATNGKIAFVRSDGPEDLSPELHLMDADGSNQRLVRELAAGVDSLEWSPDGTKLLFGAEGAIYSMNADGSQETRLTTADGSSSMWPAWSPDGARIAFRSVGDMPGDSLVVMNADGTDRSEVVTESMGPPSWSPDGRRIAYAGFVEELWIVTLGATPTKRAITLGGIVDQPVWSPDGSRIAYRSAGSISVVNADGTAAKRLVSPPPTALRTPPGGGDPANPAWSPDGTKIVYGLYASGTSCSIWAMNADGSGHSQLTDGRRCDRDPAWQPIPRS